MLSADLEARRVSGALRWSVRSQCGSGQLCPREQVRQAPRAGERTRKPIERSESGREHVRGVDCMGQRPGVGRMGVGCQKGSQRGGEEKQKRHLCKIYNLF